MTSPITIRNRRVGEGEPTYVVAEIGINHNGSLDLAKRLIAAAAAAGCDAVKFQKRTIEVVYTREELDRPRESPFGTTNRALKEALEFGQPEYEEIDRFCRSLGIAWFASCWDEASVDFIERFDVPCFKIASASITDDALLRRHRKAGKPLIVSTGMTTLDQIDHAVTVIGRDDLVLLHCTSTYPAKEDELNLRVIPKLLERYRVPIGYSGHEVGLYTTLVAVALGACMVERHLTLNRAMFGTDQAASVEPDGMRRLIKSIRAAELAFGDGDKRVFDSEVPIMQKLRRVGL